MNPHFIGNFAQPRFVEPFPAMDVPGSVPLKPCMYERFQHTSVFHTEDDLQGVGAARLNLSKPSLRIVRLPDFNCAGGSGLEDVQVSAGHTPPFNAGPIPTGGRGDL